VSPPRSEALSARREGPSACPYSSKVGQRGSHDPLSELVAEELECLFGRRRRHLAVDVHRHSDLAVPQDRHRYPRVDVQGHEQGRTSPPGCVYRDDRDASLDPVVRPDCVFAWLCTSAAVEVSRMAASAVPPADLETGPPRPNPGQRVSAMDRPLGRPTPSRNSTKMPPRASPCPWPARPSIIEEASTIRGEAQRRASAKGHTGASRRPRSTGRQRSRFDHRGVADHRCDPYLGGATESAAGCR
jgi:hypothetical protein